MDIFKKEKKNDYDVDLFSFEAPKSHIIYNVKGITLGQLRMLIEGTSEEIVVNVSLDGDGYQ